MPKFSCDGGEDPLTCAGAGFWRWRSDFSVAWYRKPDFEPASNAKLYLWVDQKEVQEG